MGLGTLAGLNLYLTVFVTGLALQMDWVALPAGMESLEVLEHPFIIGVAGALYLLEFFTDKIPWVDTAWDMVHTIIRPLGAAGLAVAAMGEAHPVFEVVAVLLAGGMALSTHIAKAGTRVLANASPEPISNIGLSLAEDGLVIGGLGLLAFSPIVGASVAALVVAVILFFLPQITRGIRMNLWLAWKKLTAPPENQKLAEPLQQLPGGWLALFRQKCPLTTDIEWATPCVTRKGVLLAPNISGWLVGLKGNSGELYFIGRTWRGGAYAAMDTRFSKLEFTEGLLANKLSIEDRDRKWHQTFLFEQGMSQVFLKLEKILRKDGASTA